MAHKPHSEEVWIRAVQQHDEGRPASVVLQGDEHQPRLAQSLAGAGDDDRAHGPRRGRAGRPDPHLAGGLEKR